MAVPLLSMTEMTGLAVCWRKPVLILKSLSLPAKECRPLMNFFKSMLHFMC